MKNVDLWNILIDTLEDIVRKTGIMKAIDESPHGVWQLSSFKKK